MDQEIYCLREVRGKRKIISLTSGIYKFFQVNRFINRNRLRLIKLTYDYFKKGKTGDIKVRINIHTMYYQICPKTYLLKRSK